MKFGRRIAALAAGLSLLIGLTGCDLWVQQSTLTNGETSDGVSARVGDVYVANAVLIADGGRANLVVSLVNEAENATHVTIAFGDERARRSVENVEAGITQIGRRGGPLVIIDDFKAQPGTLYGLWFINGNWDVRLAVPVLTAEQAMYRDLGPATVDPTGARGQGLGD